MARDRTVTIRMPEELLSAAIRAARTEEVSPAELIRDAVAARVAELAGGPEDPLATLRRNLQRDFSSAKDWLDLQRSLRARGLVLREREGDLWLHAWPRERPLAPLARFGASREELSLLYRAPFPAFGPRPRPRLLWARRAA